MAGECDDNLYNLVSFMATAGECDDNLYNLVSFMAMADECDDNVLDVVCEISSLAAHVLPKTLFSTCLVSLTLSLITLSITCSVIRSHTY